jgi:hypothetical protein
MNNRLFMICIFVATISVSFASAELPLMPLAYNLDVKYVNGSLSLESLTLEHAYVPESSVFNEDYTAKLFDVYGQEVYNYTFSFALEISKSAIGCIDDDGVYNETLCGGPSYIKLDATVGGIVVPYSFIGGIIKIYSADGGLKLSVNVSEYAEYCGDGECTESFWSCPQDCEATSEDEATLEKYEKEYKEENKKDTWNTILGWKYYIMALVLLIIIIMIIIRTRHKNQGIN